MSGETNPDQKKLYNLYALFGVSLALSVVPHVSAALLCAVLFLWLLIAAYIIRGKAEEHSLTHNHTIYIIRSLWIGALISVIMMIAASAYMLGHISYEPFEPCANVIAGKGINALQEMSTAEISAMAMPCIDDFIHFNWNALMAAMLIGVAPPLLYMAYRFILRRRPNSRSKRQSNPTGFKSGNRVFEITVNV